MKLNLLKPTNGGRTLLPAGLMGMNANLTANLARAVKFYCKLL
jgi:hypothetical protein